jgi:hypothetical protein
MWGGKYITSPGQLISFERSHGNTGFNINVWAKQHPAAAALIGVKPVSNTRVKGSSTKSKAKDVIARIVPTVVPGTSNKPVSTTANGRVNVVSKPLAKAVSKVPIKAKATPNPISDVVDSNRVAAKSANVTTAKKTNNAPSVPTPIKVDPKVPEVAQENNRIIVRSGTRIAQ